MIKAKSKVIVRTYSAGVHYGTLQSRDGKECVLTNAKRVWSWKGANTLHEIASKGVGSGSRISVSVPSILLTEVTEILECSAEGSANLESAGWNP